MSGIYSLAFMHCRVCSSSLQACMGRKVVGIAMGGAEKRFSATLVIGITDGFKPKVMGGGDWP
jgi:hypothetical protein